MQRPKIGGAGFVSGSIVSDERAKRESRSFSGLRIQDAEYILSEGFTGFSVGDS